MTLLRPIDLAETLHVSVGHVYRLVAKRRVPFVKLGGAVRFRKESIERWIEKQEVVSVSQLLGRGQRSRGDRTSNQFKETDHGLTNEEGQQERLSTRQNRQ